MCECDAAGLWDDVVDEDCQVEGLFMFVRSGLSTSKVSNQGLLKLLPSMNGLFAG